MDREKLIAMLMQQEYVSGEWISAQLGVTRAGVWKAIEGLRREGYAIESAPRKGYHIAPPKDAVWPSLIRRHLNTAWAGQRIDYYDQAGSTNQLARELGEQDASRLANFHGIIRNVAVLGSSTPVAWTRDAEGLHIRTDYQSDKPIAFKLTID